MNCNILIIGGGFCGLRLAMLLQERGEDFQLLEARERFGGRILSKGDANAAYDLGPAWFWPGQLRMESLIKELGLQSFEQYSNGELLFENEIGHVQRGRGFSSMEGSCRLDGGFGELISAITRKLPEDRLHLSRQVIRVQKQNDRIEVTCQSGENVSANNVIFALPPRLAANLTFAPALPEASISALHGTPTWMAGQAKAVAVYQYPFWRENGLSGDAMSRRGPLVEIHDASSANGGFPALFGFVGVPAIQRQNETWLRHEIIDQLVRLFGPEAKETKQLFLKDWAFDTFTATAIDHHPVYSHPQYGRPKTLHGLWKNRILFAGTEMAPRFGGYLEGALEAAEDTFDLLRAESV